METVPTACSRRSSTTSNKDGTDASFPREPENFRIWTTFEEELLAFHETLREHYNKVGTLTSKQLLIYKKHTDAGCETDVETSLQKTTFPLLVELLQIIGIESDYARGISVRSVILNADFVWGFKSDWDELLYRLIIEVKPFWSLVDESKNLSVEYAEKEKITVG